MRSMSFTLVCLLAGTAAAQNFTGPDLYAKRAEDLRRELAVWWQGHPLPKWSRPCPITVKEHTDPNRSGGGATSFSFEKGEAFGWAMSVTGTREDLLRDTLPHEVNHTVLATLLRRPSPRWLDEGLCQLFEGPTEHKRHRQAAARFQSHPWAAWRRLDWTGEYPQDSDSLQALYGTGFSVVEWLLVTGGRDRLKAFVADAAPMEQRFRTHYNTSPAQAEQAWRKWLQGRPTDCTACGCPINGETRRQYTAKPPATVGSKPRLVAVGSPWCLACIPFSNDWGMDQGFRMDLSNRVEVSKVDGQRCATWCRQHAVQSYPAFVVLWPDGTHTTWHGYTGKRELLSHVDNLQAAYAARQAQGVAPLPPETEPVPTPETTPEPTIDIAALQAAAQQAAQTTIKDALDRLQAEQDKATQATQQAAQAEATQSQPEAPAGLPWGTIGLAAATAAGIGVPGWALYAVQAMRVARRVRRRGEQKTPNTRPDESPSTEDTGTERTVVIDAPPAKERHRIDTRFVQVAADNYQKAHELARAEIGRRYPGSLDILEAELSLTRQFLAGDKQQET